MSASQIDPLPQSPQYGRSRWLVLAGVGLGTLMGTLGSSIVNITLPTLQQTFTTNLATVEWVILSYTLVITALTLGAARLGDMRNKKNLYLGGLFLFTLGSFLCAISPHIYALVGFRVVQGLGAAFTTALGFAIVTQVFPAEERGRALGMLGTTVSVGIASGPPLGGLIIGALGWHWVFMVNVPIGLISLLFVYRFVPNLHASHSNQSFDLFGAAVLFAALSLYALGMMIGQDHGFNQLAAQACLGAGLLGLLVFILIERRTPQPMIDLSLFRDLLFDLNLLMGFLVSSVLAGLFILPYYLQIVKGYPTLLVGILMMVDPIGLGIVAPLAGILSDRFGPRLISICGLSVVTVGCLTLGALQLDTSGVGFVLHMVPIGLGMGLFMSPNNSAVMGAVPKERLGITSGLLSMTRLLGNTTGLPLMGAIFSSLVLAKAGLPSGTDLLTAPPASLVTGTQGAFHTAAVGVGAAVLVAIAAFSLDARRRKSSPNLSPEFGSGDRG